MRRLLELLKLLCVVLVGVYTVASQVSFAQSEVPAQASAIEFTFESLRSQTPSKTSSHIYVFTRKEILQSGATYLSDLLQRVPGLSVVREGSAEHKTFVYVRGQRGGKYAKILINGIDISNPSVRDLSVDIGGMTTAEIERIEISPGSQVPDYNNGFPAGVISIWTIPEKSGARAEVGSLDAASGNIDVATGNVRLAYSRNNDYLKLSVSGSKSDGIDVTRADHPDADRDGYLGHSVLVSFGKQFLPEALFEAVYAEQGHRTDTDTIPEFSPGDDTSRRFARSVTASMKVIGEERLTTISFNALLAELESFETAADFDSSSEFLGVRYTLNSSRYRKWASWIENTTGLRFFFENVYSGINLVGLRQKTLTTFDLRLDPIDWFGFSTQLNFALHTPSGFAVSGAHTLLLKPLETLTVGYTFAHNFRMPTIYENNQIYRPPGQELPLEAEQVLSHEVKLALAYQDVLEMNALFFLKQLQNEITFQDGNFLQDPATGYTYYGYELLTSLSFLGFQVNASVNQNFAPQGDLGVHIAPIAGNLFIQYTLLDRLSVSGNVYYSDTFDDLTYIDCPAGQEECRVAMPSRLVADARLAYTVSQNAQIYVKVNNLTDNRSEQVYYHPQPGLNFFVGMASTH